MAYEVSQVSFDSGVLATYLLWGYEITNEFYPANPDNLWRLIRAAAINYSKTDVINSGGTHTQIVREPLSAYALDVWNRWFQPADTTDDQANTISGETTVDSTTFEIPTEFTVGNGLLLPPRSQIRTNSTFWCSTAATFLILETAEIDKLKPYL